MRKSIGLIIVLLYGLFVFVSLTGFLLGFFAQNYGLTLAFGAAFLILLLAKKNITLIIKDRTSKK